jgi:hypothetical protein
VVDVVFLEVKMANIAMTTTYKTLNTIMKTIMNSILQSLSNSLQLEGSKVDMLEALLMKIEANLNTTTINKGSTLRIKSNLKGEEAVLQEPELVTRATRSQTGITTKNNHSIMKITTEDLNIITMNLHTEEDPLRA